MGKSSFIRIHGEGPITRRDERTGLWKFYYEDGAVYGCGEFKEGERIGEWEYFYPSGVVAQRGSYNGERFSDAIGVWLSFHPNGVLAEEENFDDEGEVDGRHREWYPSGQLASESYWRMGDEHGQMKMWYPNGKLMVAGEVNCDMPYGNWTYHHPNGQLAFVEHWISTGENSWNVECKIDYFFDDDGERIDPDVYWEIYLEQFSCDGEWLASFSPWPNGARPKVDVWAEIREEYLAQGVVLPLGCRLLNELLRREFVEANKDKWEKEKKRYLP
jgi:antitoxin component YwqK of YwqJK toxin-antitoxin module